MEEVITTLLKEFRQAYLIKKKTDNESENNKLQTMYGICEDIESAKSPEGSVLNVLEYIKHHFNEHIDMAKIASFFSYVAQELTAKITGPSWNPVHPKREYCRKKLLLKIKIKQLKESYLMDITLLRNNIVVNLLRSYLMEHIPLKNRKGRRSHKNVIRLNIVTAPEF